MAGTIAKRESLSSVVSTVEGRAHLARVEADHLRDRLLGSEDADKDEAPPDRTGIYARLSRAAVSLEACLRTLAHLRAEAEESTPESAQPG